MSDLIATMRMALADTFVFATNAQICHWNVEGPTFSQLHDLFGKIYEDGQKAVDGLAERIRTLGEFAPSSIHELIDTSHLERKEGGSGLDMVKDLRNENMAVISTLKEAQVAADKADEAGLSNFLQDRLDRHAKWDWMLGATMKGNGKRTLRQSVLYDHDAMKNG